MKEAVTYGFRFIPSGFGYVATADSQKLQIPQKGDLSQKNLDFDHYQISSAQLLF